MDWGQIGSSVIGGLSSIGTSAMGYFGNRSQTKRTMKESDHISRQRAMWDALMMPSFEKQGLIAAGINPILAYGSIGGSSGFNVSTGGFSGGFENPFSSALSIQQQKADLRLTENQADAARNEALLFRNELIQDNKDKEIEGILSDAKHEALTGVKSIEHYNENDNSYSDAVQGFRNVFENERYRNSVERTKALDVLGVIDTASSALGTFVKPKQVKEIIHKKSSPIRRRKSY